MFTGLIEDVGRVSDIISLSGGIKLKIETNLNIDDVKIGDSVSINGACQTVTEKNGQILSFEAMQETLRRTNFSNLKMGSFVNLERAMQINSRLDGHIVSGHIDNVAKFIDIKEDGIAKVMKFACNTDLIVEKGSISINGISLTVCNVQKDDFEVSILPHTFSNTNLQFLKLGEFVNIEYDIIAKYIKKFSNFEKKSKITREFLIENGF